MVKTIYIDVLFLVNLIVNYLILFCTAHICTARITRWRIALAAGFGAAYAVLTTVFSFPFLASALAKLFTSLMMILLSFGKRNLLRQYLVFLAVSLAFGGAVFAFSFLFRSDFIEMAGGVYYIHTSLPTLLFSAALCYILLSVIFRRRISDTPEKISRIKIFSGQFEVSLFALRDTGNSLRTSKNAPVIICNYETVRAIFSDEASKLLDASPPQDFPLILDKLSGHGEFSLLPISSVGAEFSLLLTFRPDRIEIDGIADNGAVIALSPTRISNSEKYSAIY